MLSRDEIQCRLIAWGFVKEYDIWTFHGEIPCGIDDMPESPKEQVSLEGDWVDNNQMLYGIFVSLNKRRILMN